ncbi:phosphate acetyltransferase [Planctomycetota bacterium]
MLKNLYIATTGPRSGKSLVLLGVMELLSRRVGRLGFFRPVIRDGEGPDNDIELVRQRYQLEGAYESFYGMTRMEAARLISQDKSEELVERVFSRYKDVERNCDFVVVEGTDLTGVTAALEFDLNARIANQIGAPVLIVTDGVGRTREEILGLGRLARESFTDEHCTIFATVVNRVSRKFIADARAESSKAWPFKDPIYVLPEDEGLSNPTVGRIAACLGAKPVHGTDRNTNRTVINYKIAAMELANFLGRLEDNCLIITPGDRADIVVGSLAAYLSTNHPQAAGVILTGGLTLSPEIIRLIEGLGESVLPIYTVESDTYETASIVNAVTSAITPDNPRRIAKALGVFEKHIDLLELDNCFDVTRSSRVTPIMFQYELIERARADKQHIVLPEGNDERILRAAEILLQREVVNITILGQENEIRKACTTFDLNLDAARIINPATSPLLDSYGQTYYELRKHKGVTEEQAHDTLMDVSYFGTMMVYMNAAHAMVSGAAHTTGHTIRPSFEFIKVRPDRQIVSSVFFMCLEDRVLVYGDCAVNPNPNPEQLADIAIASAQTAATFGIEPLVAMLSYSSGRSGTGEDVNKVREATEIAQRLRPDLKIEGPIQYDAAVDPGVGLKKMPDSEVAGRATVFIFPDLNTGNNTYKAVQRSANALAIGPVLQGLRKPVNDLSRGCTVPDIVNTVAITAIQAQNLGE